MVVPDSISPWVKGVYGGPAGGPVGEKWHSDDIVPEVVRVVTQLPSDGVPLNEVQLPGISCVQI